MKTKLLIIILFSVTLLSLSTILSAPNAFGRCTPNTDWPDGPCYGCPGCYPGLVQEKLDWEPYYDFKGKEWMESKKQEMINAIQNNTLEEWIKLTYDTQSNLNVNQYYFLNGKAPMHGMYFDKALEYENMAKLLEIVKLEFIDFSEIYTIDEPSQFILEITAYSNCHSFNAEITDKNGTNIWGEKTFALCEGNENPILVTSKIKIGYNEDNPIIIDESGKYYIQIEIDNTITKREFKVIKTNEDTISNVKLNISDNSSVLEFVGKTTNIDQELGFLFYNPDGVLISVDTAFANSDGEFKSVITTGGPLWRQVGNFTFTVQQGEKLFPDNSLTFEMTEEMVQGKLDFINTKTDVEIYCPGTHIAVDEKCQPVNYIDPLYWILLIVLIPVSIGLVIWRKRK